MPAGFETLPLAPKSGAKITAMRITRNDDCEYYAVNHRDGYRCCPYRGTITHLATLPT